MDTSLTQDPGTGTTARKKNRRKQRRMRGRLTDLNGPPRTKQIDIISALNLCEEPQRQEANDIPFNVQIAVPEIGFSSRNSSAKFRDCGDGFVKRVLEKKVKPVSRESQTTGLTFIFDPSVMQTTKKNAKVGDNEKTQKVREPSKHGCLDIAKELSFYDVLYSSTEGAPVSHSRRKLLILDLNGLLADIVSPPPKDCKSDINISRRAIFKRPFCYDFLKFCFERFEVGVWSSRSKKIIDRVVDYLLGDLKNKLLFCWDLSHCTETGFKTLENRHKTLVFKELRKIWEVCDPNLQWKKGDYNESNTLLLDDSPYKALLNPMHTAIFPHSYTYKDKNNNSLGPEGELRLYLGSLAVAENVQNYIKHHPFGQSAINKTNPSWNFYHKVITSRSSKPT